MSGTTPKLLDMMGRLIESPSVSSVSPDFDQGNHAVIQHLADWLEALDFNIEIQAVDKAQEKYNLIATLGQGDGGLVLSGHADTVPYDEHRWQYDPFRLTQDSNRLYGLGTADMKSFFALAIEAARDFTATDLRAPLIILATADEESSMSGAKALVDAGYPKARHAVIGEPTGLKPVRMHKGIFMEGIRLIGHSGHSSDPTLGENALDGMQLVLGGLLNWRDELRRDHQNPCFQVPYPTLNLGHIHGGDNPNRICAECELHIDLRPLPGMAIDELRDELHQRVRQSLLDSGLKVEFDALFSGIPAIETARESPLVQSVEQMTGLEAGAVAFGTEAPYLSQLGMDTVVIGPGDIDQAHQPDEFLAMDRIDPMVSLLRKLIRKFCVEDYRPA